MKKNLLCQLNFGHKLLGMQAMFVVGRELCLFRIETLRYSSIVLKHPAHRAGVFRSSGSANEFVNPGEEFRNRDWLCYVIIGL